MLHFEPVTLVNLTNDKTTIWFIDSFIDSWFNRFIVWPIYSLTDSLWDWLTNSFTDCQSSMLVSRIDCQTDWLTVCNGSAAAGPLPGWLSHRQRVELWTQLHYIRNEDDRRATCTPCPRPQRLLRCPGWLSEHDQDLLQRILQRRRGHPTVRSHEWNGVSCQQVNHAYFKEW